MSIGQGIVYRDTDLSEYDKGIVITTRKPKRTDIHKRPRSWWTIDGIRPEPDPRAEKAVWVDDWLGTPHYEFIQLYPKGYTIKRKGKG
jgi:hypothetical protein